jgi:DNA-binding transcriptional MerR regulator
MEKSLPAIPAKRYFTIGEVSDLCGVKPYVLRYWEQEFSQLKPMKRRGNRRYYQHHEVLLIRRIRELLYDQGFTISGARNRLSDVPLQPGDEGLSGQLEEELADEADGPAPVDEPGKGSSNGLAIRAVAKARPDSMGGSSASAVADASAVGAIAAMAAVAPVATPAPDEPATGAVPSGEPANVLWGRRASDLLPGAALPDPNGAPLANPSAPFVGGPLTPQQLRAELLSVRLLLGA